MNNSVDVVPAEFLAFPATNLNGRTVLFLSPTPAGSPLLQAQGIPHMRELAARYGIRFVLFTIESADTRSTSRAARDELRRKLKSWGITWLSMQNGRVPLLPNSTSDVIRAMPRVARLLRSEHVDLVHCRSYVPAFVMMSLKPIFRIPWIFDVRGFYPDELVKEGKWSAESTAYRTSLWLERRAFSHAAATVVVTKRQYELLLQKWPEADCQKVMLIRNCADTDKFAPNPELRQSIRKRLGIGDAVLLAWVVSAIRSLHLPSDVLNFCKICRDMLGSRLLVVTQTPGVASMLKTAGFRDCDFDIISAQPDEVPGYLSAADAGIAFIDQTHEGPGIKFAEYLAAGLPVVSNGTETEWGRLLRNRRCGVVVGDFSACSYREAALALSSILREPGMRERCREVALSEYSLQNAVRAYAGLYQRLMATRNLK